MPGKSFFVVVFAFLFVFLLLIHSVSLCLLIEELASFRNKVVVDLYKI